MFHHAAGTRWRARTQAYDSGVALPSYLTRDASFAWLRHGQGVIGLGELTRFETDTLDAADIWWGELLADLEHESEFPGESGVGPVAFGSFAFDGDRSARRGALIVPKLVMGRRAGHSWLTRLSEDDAPFPDLPAPQPPPEAPESVRYASGAVDDAGWMAAVGSARERIVSGDLAKVVLAREVLARATAPWDLRWPAGRLAERYASCWTYLVDGLVGATPEMLVRRRDGLAVSRVLAGTAPRHGTLSDDALRAAVMLGAEKDRREHQLAVDSVVAALEPFVQAMHVSETPYILDLPNVLHLASDIVAVTGDAMTSLGLAAQLHPSAAVAGTPRHQAMQVISELEGVDRGRYAGPVGWIDAAGDGEWGIALRCGALDESDPSLLHLFAGCGIVAGSDPAEELAESNDKLQAMRTALAVDG